MYINFEQMMTSGLTMSDVGYLLMIRQKEEMASVIPKEKIDSYKASGYIELQKNGKWKITPRGGSLLMLIETPGLTPEVEGIRDRIVGVYNDMGKDTGAIKEVEKRLIWFVANTNFKEEPIVRAVISHIDLKREYTMRLDNLIWKPSNVYSVHMSLSESTLFDTIIKMYGMTSDLYLRENKNKELAWLFAVSRLPDPSKKIDKEYTITGDVKMDIERISDIKKELGRRLKMSI